MSAVVTPDKQQTLLKSKIYTVLGPPIPLARPRFGKNKKVYDSQYQEKLGAGLQLKFIHNAPPLEIPLHLNIAFYFACGKTHPHGQPHTKTPDLDNLIKFLLDAGNGVTWKDDCQIVSIFAQKYYDLYERTEFTIHPIADVAEKYKTLFF